MCGARLASSPAESTGYHAYHLWVQVRAKPDSAAMKRILSGVMCDGRRRAGPRRLMGGEQPPHYDWVLMRSWLRLEGQPKALTVESGVLQIANGSDEVSAGASSVLALSCSAAAHRQFSGLAAALRQQQADAVCALTNWAPVQAAATGR